MAEQSGCSEKTIKYMFLEDCANEPYKQTEPYHSSPWQLDRRFYTLDYYENEGLLHSVPLIECLSSQGRWGWLDHLCNRGASPFVIGTFAYELKLHLGESHPGSHDVRTIVRKQLAMADALKGRRSRSSKPSKEQHA